MGSEWEDVMGDIVLVILAVVYVAACVLIWRDKRRGPQQLTEADIAELEQMLKNYGYGSNL